MEGLPGRAYDELITAGLDTLIKQSGLGAHTDGVDHAEATEVLAAHLEKVVTRTRRSAAPRSLGRNRTFLGQIGPDVPDIE